MEKYLVRTLTDRHLNWNLLRTFLVIAEERSISNAARRLHITQPAVSYSLRRLEEQLGKKLIERHGSTFDITQVGLSVLKVASEVHLSIQRGLVQELENRTEIRGTVRLVIVSGLEFAKYDNFLTSFHKIYPQVGIEVDVLQCADIPTALTQKIGTAALTPASSFDHRLEYQTFFPQRYSLYCGRRHRFFGLDDIKIDDCLDEDFVAFFSDKIGHALAPLSRFREEHGFTGRIVASSANVAEVCRLIIAGFGIGCLPEHVAHDFVRDGSLMRLPPLEGVANIDIYLASLAGEVQMPHQVVFLNHLRKFSVSRDS